MNDARSTAQRLLHHYLQTVFRKAGLGWGGDNDVEVYNLVDQIIGAAQPATAPYLVTVEYSEVPMYWNGPPPTWKRSRTHVVAASSIAEAERKARDHYANLPEQTSAYIVNKVTVGEPI